MLRRRPLPLRMLMLALPFALGGCGIYDWANANMPVIGERCENWQCFTASGQEQSRLNQQQRLHPSDNPSSGGDVAAPSVGTAPATTQPLAPPMPPNGAYIYVPREQTPGGVPPAPDMQANPLE